MDIKVGDVVAWDEVPDGALVRDEDGDHAVRLGSKGCWVTLGRAWYDVDSVRWPWPVHGLNLVPAWAMSEQVTIIALDVPANATADDLRELAEVFEVRAAWERLMLASRSEETRNNYAVAAWFADNTRDARLFIARLHRAGWRPNMTTEDAADLLAMPFTCCTCGKPITNSAELAACRGAGPVRAGRVRMLAEVCNGEV